MAFCPNCGAAGAGNFCANCGQQRQEIALSIDDEMEIPIVVDESAVRSEKARAYIDSVSGVRHGVPALLSFFIPGLGQLVKGSVLKGIAFHAGCWMAAALALFTFWFGALVLFGAWVAQIAEAYLGPDEATERKILKAKGDLPRMVAPPAMAKKKARY